MPRVFIVRGRRGYVTILGERARGKGEGEKGEYTVLAMRHHTESPPTGITAQPARHHSARHRPFIPLVITASCA
ncbi:hypothetical protein E2C01_083271 [Portunus trituberculatus]|uniref:Uncharacterized protein n=1 Tax=Portunus trituberculatus TaxID=210409 RepID=A0A5B7IUP7_PORTR|nr:hypothetical protein [Portunus trituberculatus]